MGFSIHIMGPKYGCVMLTKLINMYLKSCILGSKIYIWMLNLVKLINIGLNLVLSELLNGYISEVSVAHP